LEQLLAKQFDSAAAQSLEIDTEELLSDLYATQDYRANLVKIMAGRAIAHMGQASVFK
jgi:carbon-monoxide dehydrogenase medium subunit